MITGKRVEGCWVQGVNGSNCLSARSKELLLLPRSFQRSTTQVLFEISLSNRRLHIFFLSLRS